MFNFVIQMGQIVGEKEFLLRQGMEVMGLNFFIYWMTWFITNSIQNMISGALLIIAGLVFQLKFFLLNDPSLYIVLFFLFGFAMVAFACFVSVFLSKGSTATSFGFALYLVGVITQGFVTLLYTENTSVTYRNLFSLLPFALLGQGVSNLASASSGDGAVGLRWDKRFDNSFFALHDTYMWLLLDTLIFAVLTLLIDGYLAKEDPRIWIRRLYGYSRSNTKRSDLEAGLIDDEDVPAEVLVENNKAQSGTNDQYAVRINNLCKTYYSYTFGLCPDSRKDFKAVSDLCLTIPNGELLCLLGPNGGNICTSFS